MRRSDVLKERREGEREINRDRQRQTEREGRMHC